MNDSQIDHLIKSYGSSHAPSGFASDVWNRIAVEPDSAGLLSAWNQFLAETLARLSQPAGAIAACAAFVIAGVLIGIGSSPESLSSKVQYIQSVSPFIRNTGP